MKNQQGQKMWKLDLERLRPAAGVVAAAAALVVVAGVAATEAAI
jgi:hypothetical protein